MLFASGEQRLKGHQDFYGHIGVRRKSHALPVTSVRPWVPKSPPKENSPRVSPVVLKSHVCEGSKPFFKLCAGFRVTFLG